MSWTRADPDDLQARVQSMIQRGTVRSVDDALKMQALDLELMHGHRPTRVEHWHGYGFSYHPHPGSEVLTVALGGNPDHVVVIAAADRRYRISGLQAGEVAFGDDQNQRVHFKRDCVWVETTKRVVTKAPMSLFGADDPTMPRVMTEAGPSSVMRAKV